MASIKLKLVLKSNQTRVVGIISTYAEHRSCTCFLSIIMFLHKLTVHSFYLVNKTGTVVVSDTDEKSKHRDVLRMC